jgi:adenine-specific DNA-methyltransferase
MTPLISIPETETYGVKYIGSKNKLLPYIGKVVAQLEVKTAIDVFSGTTRVAQNFRGRGIATTTSDLSWATECYANTYVHNKDNAHLKEFIKEMNKLAPINGWLSSNYTGEKPQNVDRSDGRCFQLKNASKADAARDYIETLDLEPWEKMTLVTSVIRALDAVDNTVGVQQAYLKEWCKRSYNDIEFKLPVCLTGPTAMHHEGDCLKIDYAAADLAYLDPPYSPHAYSTYYHIWDSIARWDKPETGLKAKRRVDRIVANDQYDDAMESPWNRESKAVAAFGQIIDRLPVKHLLISYSDESLVKREVLLETCEEFGAVDLIEVDYKRNIMSQIGNATKNAVPSKGQKNKELIIHIKKK